MNSNSHFESKTFTAFKEGDEVAFSYFYAKFFLKIQSFCLQFLYDSNDAENLAQEAFVYLWEKRESIEFLPFYTLLLNQNVSISLDIKK
jgi:RNA polymerase sigma-70 factor (ECF subfamily)